MTKALSAAEVAAFLAANPDFFSENEDLLTSLKLPDSRKGTVSLVEKQMDVLRQQQRKSRQQLQSFVDAAEQNKDIFDKSSRLVLNLIAANKSSAFFDALERGLKRDLKCKAYSLLVFGKPRQINHYTSRIPTESAREYVGALMKARQPTLGVLRDSEQDFLFRHQSAKVKSAAVLAVRERNKRIALLAIGSEDPHYFSPNLDTLFIGFIADALAKLLPRHLPK